MNLSLVLAIVLLVPGIPLAFIPVVPATLYLLIVSLGYAVLTHFERLSGVELGVLIVVTALSILVDHLAGLIGARWGGASRRAMLFGFIGAIIGVIVGGPLMSFVGLFSGIFVTEVLQLRSHLEAFQAAKGGLIGALVGYLINILLALIFFTLFIVFTIR